MSINGDDYLAHKEEETCYNPCRCKCLTGSLIGSLDEIIFDESKMRLPLLADYVSLEGEFPVTARQANAGGQQNEIGRELQLSGGQCLKLGAKGNNLELLTQGPNQIRSRDESREQGEMDGKAFSGNHRPTQRQ